MCMMGIDNCVHFAGLPKAMSSSCRAKLWEERTRGGRSQGEGEGMEGEGREEGKRKRQRERKEG